MILSNPCDYVFVVNPGMLEIASIIKIGKFSHLNFFKIINIII